jgi:signal transduction histidine kinase
VFFRDSAGTFLTPARFATAPGVPGATVTEATHSCSSGALEWVDIDYRGVTVVHGQHPVFSFAGATCVDAHLSHDEALAPAGALLLDLVKRGGGLAAVGVLIALVLSHWMASPVRRLAVSARALETGHFERPMPIAGPSEVRKLARSFASMARALSEQMAQEQQARREAERANRAKDEFLAVLSHELRTPLTATLGWARLLRLGQLDAGRVELAIDAIERSARMQSRLIEDLLDISGIIAGRLHLQQAEVSLAGPVRGAFDEVRPAAEKKNVAIELVGESAPVVVGDAVRLQQVIVNLLTNAVKFTRPGGRVTVQLREVNGTAELSVADTGIGIPPEFLPHVFEPFRQADQGPTRMHGGLGLGLAIVHHLVKLHGGTVQAASQGPDTGATFTVRLPTIRAHAPAEIHTHVAGALAPSALLPRLDDLRILLVEDDEGTRRLVTAMLETAGATVDGAATAAEGRRLLASRAYEAIVSDLAMPNEDGYSFMSAVRASGNLVPAVALTALVRREDVAAARAAGFQVHLAKPVDRENLITAVADLTLPKSA